MFHIHQDHASRDCDGPFYSSSVYVPENEIFKSEDKDAMDIAMDWGMRWAFHTPDGAGDRVTVTIEIDDQDRYVISYGRSTDEGFDSGQLIICEDADCEFGSSQRDVYAEAMGY